MAIVKDLIVLGETNGIGKTQSAEFIEGGVSLINKYLTSAAAATNLSNYITSANVVTALNNKVDKVSGKGLSTNDYTTAEKNKLAGLAASIATTGASGYMSSAMVTKLDTITNYLPLSGGIMTGAIKRYYGSASDDPTINISSLNQDVWIWRVSDGSYNYGTTASYGFGVKYLGTGTGANNNLAIYADNQGGTQIQAAVMNQSGVIDFKTNITKSGYTIWHAGNDGSGSGLDADLLDGKHASAFSLSSHTHSYLPLSGGTLTGDLYINKDTDASGTNSAGSLVVGTKTGVNVAIDANEIMARNNNAPSTLYINEDGGDVIMMGAGSASYKVGIGTSSSPTSKLHVNGDIRTNKDLYIGSASTVQCHQQYDNTNKCLKFIFD